ncbi:hypothetical protein D3C84_154680 [compost metagenome]
MFFQGDGFALGLEGGPTDVIDQAQLAAFCGQAQVGVVFAQDQPVFGARGEHAVRLLGAQGDQVVDQHADIRLVAARAPAVLALGAQRGVAAGQQTLRTGLFVTGGAVDLPGEEQAGDHLGFQAVFQVARIEVVVLDGVAGADDMGVFHATDGAHQLQLHVERQGGGNAVGIQLVGGQTFRLDKHLVAVLVGEAVDLVFDRRAVARADAFDHPGIHRRTVEVGGDDLVGARIGVGDPATDLPRLLFGATEKGHQRRWRIPGLLGHQREIHRTAIDARRRAGLQAADPQRQFPQALGQGDRRRIAGTAAGIVLHADVDKSAEEGAGGQDHRIGEQAQAHLGDYAFDFIVLDDQVIGGLLKYPQVGLVFQGFANRRLVQHPVGLGAGGAYRRALAAVEHAELDAALVGGGGHGATQGIDFLDQVALADPADGRIAAHLAEGFHVVGQQQGFYPHACRCQSSFGAGMTTADHDHLKTGREIHHAPRAC